MDNQLKEKDELEMFFPKNKMYFWGGAILIFVIIVAIIFKKLNNTQQY